MRPPLDKKRNGAKIPQLVSHEGEFPGSEYDADEDELLAAMQRYMRDAGVRFPSFVEVLRVAMSLGWRKDKISTPATQVGQPAAVKARKAIEGYHRPKKRRA